MNEEAERFELQELTRDQLWHIDPALAHSLEEQETQTEAGKWLVGLLVFFVILVVLELV